MSLKDFVPDYYQDVYEMTELIKAEQGELESFDSLINRTLLNEFVQVADSTGISVFENQLGIIPEETDSLGTRRYNILMYLLPPSPITINYFRYLLATLNIPATVNVEYAVRNVVVKAKRSEISKPQIKRLEYLLNVYLPANLTFNVTVHSESTINQQEYIGVTHRVFVGASAPPQLNLQAQINLNKYIGVGYQYVEVNYKQGGHK